MNSQMAFESMIKEGPIRVAAVDTSILTPRILITLLIFSVFPLSYSDANRYFCNLCMVFNPASIVRTAY
jgi:hypothetical protein